MKLIGIPSEELKQIVLLVSQAKYDGNLQFNNFDPQKNFTNFTLRVANSKGKGARRSAKGDRTVAACWHAHKDVMEEIFQRHPGCRLITALATYNGADDFYNKFENTHNYNCGSQFCPVSIGDCCECAA